MRYVGIALVIISLTVGALSAATAYHVPLSYPDEEFKTTDKDGNLVDLTLNAPTGVLTLRNRKVFEAFQQGKIPIAKKLKPEVLKLTTYEEETGLVFLPDGSTIPLARQKDKLTPNLLQVLRVLAETNDPQIAQKYVIVQEFSFARWPFRWFFAVSVIGLLGGALILRSASKKALAASGILQQAEGPETALVGLKETVDDLRRAVGRFGGTPDLEALRAQLDEGERQHLEAYMEAQRVLAARLGPDHITQLKHVSLEPSQETIVKAIRERLSHAETHHLEKLLQARSALAHRVQDEHFATLHDLTLSPADINARLKLILERLSAAQMTHMAAFVEARPLLIARFGMTGFAELMDRYAASERQINRAWSAAADGYYEETVDCLDLAAEYLEETMARLRGG